MSTVCVPCDNNIAQFNDRIIVSHNISLFSDRSDWITYLLIAPPPMCCICIEYALFSVPLFLPVKPPRSTAQYLCDAIDLTIALVNMPEFERINDFWRDFAASSSAANALSALLAIRSTVRRTRSFLSILVHAYTYLSIYLYWYTPIRNHLRFSE